MNLGSVRKLTQMNFLRKIAHGWRDEKNSGGL